VERSWDLNVEKVSRILSRISEASSVTGMLKETTDTFVLSEERVLTCFLVLPPRLEDLQERQAVVLVKCNDSSVFDWLAFPVNSISVDSSSIIVTNVLDAAVASITDCPITSNLSFAGELIIAALFNTHVM